MTKPELSIIILNYNTIVLLKDCLNSLKKIRDEVDFEVIVSDNGSSDGSMEMVEKDFGWVKIVKNNANLGFAKGNNAARNISKGKYILFLNTDTIVPRGTLKETMEYLKLHKGVGAVTCKIVLPNGKLDRDARRRFPTPWISLNRLFLGNGGLYWYGDIPEDTTHEVEVIQGAFFLAYKKVLDDVDWFSEEYFLDGEDIDLCWKIKEKGWKIIYYPKVSILHLKGATKGKIRRNIGKITKIEKLRFIKSGVDSMEIFYRKFMWKRYPLILNIFVIFGIRLLKLLRSVKAFFR